MKNLYFLLLIPAVLSAQTWQWGKRGGSDTYFDNTIEFTDDLATDPDGNVFVLSKIGMPNPDVDGNTLTTYGGSRDVVISSFACDGSFRWANVIGGQDSDRGDSVETDTGGNVYVSGFVVNRYDDFFQPGLYPKVHFSPDYTLDYIQSETEGNRTMFLVKYNNQGQVQWLVMPQPENVAQGAGISNAASLKLKSDADGNLYWLCILGPDTYCNGSLVVPTTGIYVLKYNASGTYQGAVLLDFQIASDTSPYGFSFEYDDLTDHYYIGYSHSQDEGVVTAGNGSTALTHAKNLLAFDVDGSFLWLAENDTSLPYTGDCKVLSDGEGNVYFTAQAATVGSINDPNPIMESFNGVQFTAPPGLGTQPNPGVPGPAIVKLDSEGNTLWQTMGYTTYTTYTSGIGVYGDIVAQTGGNAGLNWQNQSIAAGTGGFDVYVARFDTTDGDIIGISKFTSPTATEDAGTAIAPDPFGNFYVGGYFGTQVTVNNDTLINDGGQTDFFVAKFGANCPLSTPDPTAPKGLKAWPNPVNDVLHLDNTQTLSYSLFDNLGRKVKEGQLETAGALDCSGLPQGLYLLVVETAGGGKESVKVVKK